MGYLANLGKQGFERLDIHEGFVDQVWQQQLQPSQHVRT